ncbi:MAG: DUF6445 family protein [Pseudomonadota bacterium]
MTNYPANQDLTIDVQRVGQSGEPMLVVDDFLANPAEIVAAAQAAPDWRDLPPGGYPGRRAALPRDYVRSVVRRMDGPIRRQLFSTPMRLDRFDCSFSLVTRAPEELGALQRVPHIDIARETRVAILHYLCGSEFGGTAFFRQANTELEQITPADRQRYLAERTQGLNRLHPGNTYPDADTPGYVRTGFVEAKFNRLAAYRSFTLHSGIIDTPEALSADPSEGRLTANLFLDYVPEVSE